MKKRVIAFLTAALLIGGLQPSYAAQKVNARVADHRITLNGTMVFNKLIKYPMLEYKSVTYLPLTSDNCRLLGIRLQWSEVSGLKLDKTTSSVDSIPQSFNLQMADTSKAVSAEIADFNIEINGKAIDNARLDYPVLFKDNLAYLPLTWSIVSSEFGGKTMWSEDYGLSVYNWSHDAMSNGDMLVAAKKVYLQDALSRYETVLEVYDASESGYDQILKSASEIVKLSSESVKSLDGIKNDATDNLNNELRNQEAAIVTTQQLEDVQQTQEDKQSDYELGTTLSIKSVIESGKYVQMADGSLWEVNPSDSAEAEEWSADDEVLLYESTSAVYKYKLFNFDKDVSVEARLVSR
ncbi:hypothetical protein EAL2_808p03330 (plasmid) [Peptoclostridium acidaminophilum DSM 3953]|uniref:Copper amine oxidase-like N-terminal domain-containing protein n=1 Tax=Peptoclostridium acidaminophilum DSM 3953 TaxID=1286171 RepID=W8TJ70_PEPAC|nr:hypothetical protein [Peptoclostridium acidaminophilum]AHM57838.1 hypothetical protein EAL2_808p03330 [Peptoclostridium acidaminophilum DSM 3953]